MGGELEFPTLTPNLVVFRNFLSKFSVKKMQKRCMSRCACEPSEWLFRWALRSKKKKKKKVPSRPPKSAESHRRFCGYMPRKSRSQSNPTRQFSSTNSVFSPRNNPNLAFPFYDNSQPSPQFPPSPFLSPLRLSDAATCCLINTQKGTAFISYRWHNLPLCSQVTNPLRYPTSQRCNNDIASKSSSNLSNASPVLHTSIVRHAAPPHRLSPTYSQFFPILTKKLRISLHAHHIPSLSTIRFYIE